jgi:hypothetical protein
MPHQTSHFLTLANKRHSIQNTKKAFAITCEGLNLLERVKGFEPSTHGLGIQRGYLHVVYSVPPSQLIQGFLTWLLLTNP